MRRMQTALLCPSTAPKQSVGVTLSPLLLAQDTLPTYRTWSPHLQPGWEPPWGSSSHSVLSPQALLVRDFLSGLFVSVDLLKEFSWILGFD